ncbi:hypothetical protein IWW38_002203 [Coemansia aciculifera]|uniref:Uncharacterized protein n=1 Tax=Coemansia aciculifera TaxID=417176 RepID=A0ACC1M552_9FUNG|nr:hypothetical protein IWW38_002203 [Coemansia aciculifera]
MTTITQPPAQVSFSANKFCGNRDTEDGEIRELVQRHLRPDCQAVCELATPNATAICDMATKLAKIIATDLEARFSQAARGKGDGNNPLSAYAKSVLPWTGYSKSTNTRSKVDTKSSDLDAEYIVPCYESLLLFVAHHVKAFVTQQAKAGHINPANCRLILPVTDESMETVCVNGVDDSKELVRTMCGMFPFDCTVSSQAAPAPHLLVASAEIVTSQDEFEEAVLRLTKETKAFYFTQHNRRFAWGLTVCRRNIRTYVFGDNGAWSSRDMDVASASGRRAFISLLVNWSLCSVDRLGFDPSICCAFDSDSGRPYFEIDVHEKNASTGKVASRTYFSARCVGVAAANLTGRHARYFAASDSFETMDNPTVMIKDMWMPMTNRDHPGETGDERSILDVLNAAFDSDSEFDNKFPQLVSTGPVYLCRGDEFVEDTTATALAGLLLDSKHATTAASSSNARGPSGRHHIRTVMNWAGDTVSAANNANQVVIAIADAMTALSAAHKKCNIVHGNISDRAILFQVTTGGVKGALAEFDYATYANCSAHAAHRDLPELTMFQSIRSLESAAAPRSPLDDW